MIRISLMLERPGGEVPIVTIQPLDLASVEATASAELVFA